MGIYDRDYYQDDRPQGMQLGRPQSAVVKLVILNAAFFLVNLFTQSWLFNQMAATPEVWQKPWLLWKVVTYGFAHSSTDLFHILFNMFALWMLGREVEQKYGGREFACIYMVALVLGGVVWTLRLFAMGEMGGTLVGASGAVTAIVLLFCLNFPKRTILLFMVIPTPAWVLGAIVIVMNFFSLAGVGGSEHVAYDVHLVGVVVAVLYFKSGVRLSRFLPAGKKDRGSFSVGGALKGLKPKPKLRVYEGEDDEEKYSELDEQGDRLLDKVHQEGEDSLTSKERRLLEAYSRRMRQKHR